MEKIKNFFKSLIGEIIITVFTTIIANFIVEKITKFSILKLIWEKLLKLFNLILIFLNTKISIWIYIAISIGLVFIFYLIIQNRKAEIKEPDFLRYREDKYKDRVKFRWNYEKNYEGKYQLNNFTPVCECGCQLDEKQQIGNVYFGTNQYVCPKCGKNYGDVLSNEETESFRKILISNIENGEYKDAKK